MIPTRLGRSRARLGQCLSGNFRLYGVVGHVSTRSEAGRKWILDGRHLRRLPLSATLAVPFWATRKLRGFGYRPPGLVRSLVCLPRKGRPNLPARAWS